MVAATVEELPYIADRLALNEELAYWHGAPFAGPVTALLRQLHPNNPTHLQHPARRGTEGAGESHGVAAEVA